MRYKLILFGLMILVVNGIYGQHFIDVSSFDLPERILVFERQFTNYIVIEGLIPGQDYQFNISDPDGNALSHHIDYGFYDVRSIGLASGGSIVIQFSEQPPATSVISIEELGSFQKHLHRMPGMMVSGGHTPDFLVRDVLIGGNCFDVTGVKIKGNAGDTGTFSADSAVIGLESGVILASGSIANALGPNAVPNVSTSFGDQGGDPDLAQLTNGTIFDAVGIEFDFTPTDDFVRFKYVFASDEYCEFTGTAFNDVFGFFLSGPGINGPFTNGAVNLALIPGSSQYVAINNVNHNSFSEFYRDNTPINQPQNQNIWHCDYDVSPAPGITSVLDEEGVSVELLEYDGFTAVFEAQLTVIPCETYHIKLVVADVTDGIYDSAVFLEANSFNAGSGATLEAGVIQTGGTEAYEGCYDAYLQICRLPNSDEALPLEVLLNIPDSSSATPGVDLCGIRDSDTIPAHQDCITIPLDIYSDNLEEGTETLLVETNFLCSCNSPYVELEITDVPIIEVEVEDITICEEEGAILSAIPSGGIPLTSYTFEWSDGSNSQTHPVFPYETTTYSVTVSDFCDNTGTADVTVTVIRIPRAEMDTSITLCNLGDESYVKVHLSGDGPFTMGYAINGEPQAIIDNVNPPSHLIPVLDTGIYSLISIFGDGDCFGLADGVAHVKLRNSNATIEKGAVTCYGDSTGYIFLNPLDFDGQTITNWNHGGTGDSLFAIAAGEYSFTIADSSSCLYSDTIVIGSPGSLGVELTVVKEPTCGAGNGELFAKASGGTPPYKVQWVGRDDTTSVIKNVFPGFYEVTLIDSNGCAANAMVELINSFPRINLDSVSAVSCTSDGSISVSVRNGTPPISLEWEGGLGNQNAISVSLPGFYIVHAEDSLGCRASDTFYVPGSIKQPLVDAGPDLVLDCNSDSLGLVSFLTNADSNAIVTWTDGAGNVISAPGSQEVYVQSGGTYIVQVINPNSGCSHTDSIQITVETRKPEIQLDASAILTCYEPAIELDASESSSSPSFSVQWSTDDGNIANGETSLQPTIDQPGSYTIEITDLTNGCRSIAIVEVGTDMNFPFADGGPDQDLSCTTAFVQLDGSASDSASNIGILWTSQDGSILSDENTLRPLVDQPGTYILELINLDNGCTSYDEVCDW